MVLMALDHTRDFYAPGLPNPTDLSVTTPALFFTRWVTHLCAPTFLFLAGTAAWLKGQRCSRGELARFLLTRGLWLVFLELTVFKLVWMGQYDVRTFLLLVIWAIGCSMIVLSGLIFLPLPAIAAFGGIMVVGHNLLDGVRGGGHVWGVLHHRDMFSIGPVRIAELYPLVPWIGVMALGYAFGAIAHRRRLVLGLGLGAVAAFVGLRLINGYGDPVPWSGSLLSFLNLEKYPPSLDFLLITLGIMLVALALLQNRRLWPLAVIGRVPLFYYILHLFLLRGVQAATGLQVGLGGVYVVWAGAVLVLFPLCVWFDGVKRRRRDLAWLSYL